MSLWKKSSSLTIQKKTIVCFNNLRNKLSIFVPVVELWRPRKWKSSMRFFIVIKLTSLALSFQLSSALTCHDADWWRSLDTPNTWSTCPSTNLYLRGFYRSDPSGNNGVGLLEEGKCCTAGQGYTNQPASCKIAWDWDLTLNRWAKQTPYVSHTAFELTWKPYQTGFFSHIKCAQHCLLFWIHTRLTSLQAARLAQPRKLIWETKLQKQVRAASGS